MKLFATIRNAGNLIQELEAIGYGEHKKLFKFKDGDNVEMITWKDRDITKHRKYFALMNCTLYHMPENSFINDLNVLRKTVQICIGNCDIAFGMDGDKQLQAKSISFKGMDQVEFDELYTRSLNYIVSVILKDMPFEEFEEDILNFY